MRRGPGHGPAARRPAPAARRLPDRLRRALAAADRGRAARPGRRVDGAGARRPGSERSFVVSACLRAAVLSELGRPAEMFAAVDVARAEAERLRIAFGETVLDGIVGPWYAMAGRFDECDRLVEHIRQLAGQISHSNADESVLSSLLALRLWQGRSIEMVPVLRAVRAVAVPVPGQPRRLPLAGRRARPGPRLLRRARGAARPRQRHLAAVVVPRRRARALPRRAGPGRRRLRPARAVRRHVLLRRLRPRARAGRRLPGAGRGRGRGAGPGRDARRRGARAGRRVGDPGVRAVAARHPRDLRLLTVPCPRSGPVKKAVWRRPPDPEFWCGAVPHPHPQRGRHRASR